MGWVNRRRRKVFQIAVVTYLVHFSTGCAPEKETLKHWRALSDLKPEIQVDVVQAAESFASLVEVTSVLFPRVESNHTRYVNVTGVDKDGEQVVVGIDPGTLEIVKMVRLCPRQIPDAIDVHITMAQAKEASFRFMDESGISIPESYYLNVSEVVSIGQWKRWKFVWQHVENGVRVLPDFLKMEVNATENANVVKYSKVHHGISIDLVPALTSDDAIGIARRQVAIVERLSHLKNELAVVYPNNLFLHHTPVWSDEQVLCWIVSFSRGGDHVIDVWVDAATGDIRGGSFCHLHLPKAFGIDDPENSPEHMYTHLKYIWKPSLSLMMFDTTAVAWTQAKSGFSENAISNAILESRYLFVVAHGDRTETAEKIIIAYEGSDDDMAFTPDEVPTNDLRLVFLSVCRSGRDGSGADFKDVFIENGADAFVGFDAYVCPWNYEKRLAYHLSRGLHLANAHDLADADENPPYPIVMTYGTDCLNRVRLAPLLVDVEVSPSWSIAAGSTFSVIVHINNREDVDHQVATNVTARLMVPTGFIISSGANPQNIGTVDWNSPRSVSWTVTAIDVAGEFTLDVGVFSDDLGVQVEDPDDPFHRFDVIIS